MQCRLFFLSPFVSTKQWESYYESCVIERCDNFTRREEEKWPVTPHTHTANISSCCRRTNTEKLGRFLSCCFLDHLATDGQRATVVAGQERWCTQYYIQEREIMDA